MSVDADIRSLNIAIPTLPSVIQALSKLLASPAHQVSEVSKVIESDMGLAAAVLQAVNSSLFGLSGNVQTVLHALTYLGTREVAAITLQMGLRAAFPRSPELDALWERSAARSKVMNQLGTVLQVDPWAAHAAGLFEECGKAILLRHAPDQYSALLAAAQDDPALIFLEHQAFGVSHDLLGAAMCETWGLAPGAVRSVRHHVAAHAELRLSGHGAERSITALSVLAQAAGADPERLAQTAQAVAEQMGWPIASVRSALDALQPSHDRAAPVA